MLAHLAASTFARHLSRLLAAALLAVAGAAQGATLTAIHDFRYLANNQFPALVYEFEGLAFTNDGSLWASIAANPSGAAKEFWKLDLLSNNFADKIPDTVFGLLGNPVALAGAGPQLIVGENFHQFGNVIWAFTPGVNGNNPDWSFLLNANTCGQVEGAAFAGGKLYVTCQNDGTILKIEPVTGTVLGSFSLGAQLLGLEMMDNTHLLVGDYSHHKLLVFDLGTGQVTDSIDLASLFVGYSVEVTKDDWRTIPDPDGLAYRNGTIYMSFDGDLRIFEITTGAPGAGAVPEPGTLALLGLALFALAALRFPASRRRKQ